MKPTLRFLVQEVTQAADLVRLYTFDYGLTPVEYYPGQFCVVSLPGASPPLTAPLNLASSPLRRDCFQLAVVRTGNFGTRFYDSVQPGDLVEMTVPQGKFTLELSDPRPVLIVAFDYCTTGVRSIWQYHADSHFHRPLTLLHAVREGQPALFYEEFMTTTDPQRTYLPVNLPPAPATIPEPSLASALASRPGCVVYLVGEGSDVKPTEKLLTAQGIGPDRLRIERWS